MKTTFERAIQTVQELSLTFDANKHAYLGSDYRAAQVNLISDITKNSVTVEEY